MSEQYFDLLPSWREHTYCGVEAIRRATLRAASWTLTKGGMYEASHATATWCSNLQRGLLGQRKRAARWRLFSS